MPLYEYECEACGKRFEKIQKFSDPPAGECAHCGKGPVRKLLSSPAIQFKGSGFYITDYAKKSSSEAGGKSGGSSSDSSATPSSGESKPSAVSSASASKPSDPAKASGEKKS